MVKPIIKNKVFLSQKSKPANMLDVSVALDLLDTIKAHSKECVGMAANMIGSNKTILVAEVDDDYVVMINPKIVDKSKDTYKTMESCLSLKGSRPAERYKVITVEYYDIKFKRHKRTLRNVAAQVVQHEMDHFNGIII